MDRLPPRIHSLVHLEAGLKAELELLRQTSSAEGILASQPRMLASLQEALALLHEEEAGLLARIKERRRELRDMKNIESILSQRATGAESLDKDDDALEAQVRELRRNLVLFCKQQWPLPAQEEGEEPEFVGGDFWDAGTRSSGFPLPSPGPRANPPRLLTTVVRACMGEQPLPDGMDPGLVEFGDAEVPFASLLVQVGVAELPVPKRMKLVAQIFDTLDFD
jgi:hypothetical protein